MTMHDQIADIINSGDRSSRCAEQIEALFDAEQAAGEFITDELIETARRHYRALEMSAEIMRDPRRTGNWSGAASTADAFQRQAAVARAIHDALSTYKSARGAS
jgi:hypothetical protein